MNIRLLFHLVLGLLSALPAHGEEARALASRIRSVTVYSDRAQVTREATVSIDTDPAVFVFRNLPGWVDDGSIRMTLTPPDAGRIVDVQAKRDYLARSTDEEFRKAESEVRDISERIAAADDELKVLAVQEKQVEAIKAFSLEKLSKDTLVRDVKMETYRDVVGFIGDALRDIARKKRAAQQARAALEPELSAKMKKLEDLRNRTQLEETSVFVTVQGDHKAEARLELVYMIPGATWEPVHELRARGRNPQSADVTTFAVVTQTTGESWDGVDLSFSTQSVAESLRIPELEALTLGETEATTRMVKSRISSFSRAQTAFEGQNRYWHGMKTNTGLEVYEKNYDYLQVVQSRTVELFRSLQKRGTTAHFRADGRQTVRSDGQSVRVRIGACTLQAAQKILAVPEQSLNAARTLEMVNSGSQPLLPGKVDLYHEGTFLGMTELDFVAEGERFAIYLNVADQIKLSRVLDKKHSSLVRKARNRMTVAFNVTVENLSNDEVALTLADRVPVSQNKEITVDQVDVEPDGSPDDKGILKWDLRLKPKEKRTYTIAYRIEYPPSLILELKRSQAAPASPAPASTPAKSRIPTPQQSAPEGDDLEQKILHLENMM